MFDFAETGAVIQNLTLEGTLPGNYSGAYSAPFVLAVESPLGLVMDGCHVERCSFSGRIDGGPRDGSAVMPKRDTLGSGGLVGFASNSVFSACSADADNACLRLPYATETIRVALSGEVRCISMGWRWNGSMSSW